MSKVNLEEMFSDALLKEGAGKLQKIVSGKLDTIEKDLTQKIKNIENDFKTKTNTLESLVSSKPISVNFGSIKKPNNEITHSVFPKLIKILQSTKRIEKNIMLVGNAGGGKSFLCSQLAKALNLQFYPMSVGLQTTKSDLIGYLNVHGDYITTPVRQAFENGGVLLLDEFDATHAGVVTILNSMLANGFCSFPDKIVDKHKNFICIVACNTYGKGGSIDYIGRNRLDGATLDRFITVDVGYDEAMEDKLVDHQLWTKTIRKIRDNINKHGLKVIVSPRASMQGADLLDAGFNIEEVLEMTVYKGCGADVRTKIIQGIDLGVYNKPKGTANWKDVDSSQPIKITLDFVDMKYNMSDIQADTSILADTDWNGGYNIYLSSTNSYVTGIQGKNIFLNIGDGKFTVDKKDTIKNFLRDLETYSDTVHLESQPIYIHVKMEDTTKNIYLGK